MHLYSFHQNNLQATVQPSVGASSMCLPPNLFNLAIPVAKEMILSYKWHYNVHWGIPEKWEHLIFTLTKTTLYCSSQQWCFSDGKICEENLQRGNTELKLIKLHFYNSDTSPTLKWLRDIVYSAVKEKMWKVKENQPPNLLQDNTSAPTQACISNWCWWLTDGSDRCIVYFFPQKF